MGSFTDSTSLTIPRSAPIPQAPRTLKKATFGLTPISEKSMIIFGDLVRIRMIADNGGDRHGCAGHPISREPL